MWIFFTMVSACILATKKIQEKKLVSQIGPALWWMLRCVSGIFSICIWLLLSRDLTGILHPTVLCIFITLFFLFPIQVHLYYRAMELLPISTLGMLAGIVPLTSLFLSHILLGSPISIFGLIAICLTVMAIAVLSYKQSKSIWHVKAFSYAIGAYVLFGIGNILDKTALLHMASIPYTTLSQTIATTSLLLYALFVLRDTKIEKFKEHRYTIGILWCIIGISSLCISHAFFLAPNPGYVGALQNMHILFTSLYGMCILKEEVTFRKIFVLMSMILAIIFFALA